jgi:imidazoleglycerol phosphate dehydratase HisB
MDRAGNGRLGGCATPMSDCALMVVLPVSNRPFGLLPWFAALPI